MTIFYFFTIVVCFTTIFGHLGDLQVTHTVYEILVRKLAT